MALQSPFFNNRRELSGDNAGSRAAMAAAPARAPAPVPAAPKEGESKLMVGPNIKLKGVEITDCDTLMVDGAVEATMDARIMQISARGSFKGTAEIDTAEIHGHFDGALTVRQKLVVFATGRVSGRVRYGSLVVEEGGQISGDVETGNAAASRPALQQVSG